MSKFHEIHKRFFECIIKFDLFTYLKLNSIKNYGVWKDCEINLQNLVKSWNFGCKRPLNWHFLETRAGWLRDWTYDHYLVWKGLIWTESDFTGNQSVKFESTSISCICKKIEFSNFSKNEFLRSFGDWLSTGQGWFRSYNQQQAKSSSCNFYLWLIRMICWNYDA